jgi:hypothetical protein
MKQLWIGLIMAGSLAACRNGPNNARDTTGMGSGGTAGGSIAVPAETAGMPGGSIQPPPSPGANAPGSAAAGATTTPSNAAPNPDTSRHHKSSRKHPGK